MLLGFLLVLLVLVCIAMSAVILMQRSEGGALGMGGSPSGILTVSGAGDLLTRTTSVLAAVFFVLCLLLTVVQGRTHAGGSVVDKMSVKALNAGALNAAMRPPGSALPAQATPSPTPPARRRPDRAGRERTVLRAVL
jgi:preprotein translocase subunit SecG